MPWGHLLLRLLSSLSEGGRVPLPGRERPAPGSRQEAGPGQIHCNSPVEAASWKAEEGGKL